MLWEHRGSFEIRSVEAMLIVRSPLRVSLVGGGSDIPSFYKENAFGMTLSFAIRKYIYVSIHKLVESDEILLKYSQLERVQKAEQIQHPVFRTALEKYNLNAIDISVSSDIAAGTGLGSSSSFTVGLCLSLSRLKNQKLSKHSLAELACQIELEELKEPIGKQDQFIASYGGIQKCTFHSSEKVCVNQIHLTSDQLHEVESHIHLVRCGKTRSASEILKGQIKELNENPRLSELYIEMRELVVPSVNAIHNQDFETLGKLVREGWDIKKRLSKNIENPEIVEVIEIGERLGAHGWKLLGAGGAGYILFIAPPQLRGKFQEIFGLSYISPGIDQEGAKVVYSSDEV